MAKRRPKWAESEGDAKEPTRVIPIPMTHDQIVRADKLARATSQSRTRLLQRIVDDALMGPDAEQVLEGA